MMKPCRHFCFLNFCLAFPLTSVSNGTHRHTPAQGHRLKVSVDCTDIPERCPCSPCHQFVSVGWHWRVLGAAVSPPKSRAPASFRISHVSVVTVLREENDLDRDTQKITDEKKTETKGDSIIQASTSNPTKRKTRPVFWNVWVQLGWWDQTSCQMLIWCKINKTQTLCKTPTLGFKNV